MLRTIALILVLLAVASVATAVVYVSRLRHEVTERIDAGYQPRADAYSSAFTDALWAQVERQTPVELDREVTATSLVIAASSGKATDTRGFLLASVAARSLALAENAVDDVQAPHAIAVVRELLRTEALLKRFDPDTLAAIYAESAPFGGGIFGLDEAAATYFGKPAALLDDEEAATLVTLSWTPNRCDLERIRDRANGLYAKMQSMQLAPARTSRNVLAPALLPLLAACQP